MEQEVKAERTLNDVQQEYLRTAAQAGEMQYKVVRLEKDLEIQNKRLLDLNFEAAAIQATEAKKAAASSNKEADASNA